MKGYLSPPSLLPLPERSSVFEANNVDLLHSLITMDRERIISLHVKSSLSVLVTIYGD